MPAWLASIVQVILQTGLQYLQSWYAAETAKTTEWNLKTVRGQMKSIQVSKAAEAALVESAKPCGSIPTPSSWNSTLAPLLLVLLFVQGCSLFERTTYVEARRPVPPKIVRPKVSVEPSEWSEREKILAEYAITLERAYAAARDEAIQSNLRNGYPE